MLPAGFKIYGLPRSMCFDLHSSFKRLDPGGFIFWVDHVVVRALYSDIPLSPYTDK